MGRGVTLATNHQHKTFKQFSQNFGTGQIGMRSPVRSFAFVLGGRGVTPPSKHQNIIFKVRLHATAKKRWRILFYPIGLTYGFVVSKVLNRNRNISTSQLSALLRLHLKPINVIISHGS